MAITMRRSSSVCRRSPRRCTKTFEERSNCLVCQGARACYALSTSSGCHEAWCFIMAFGSQQLAHTGRQRNLRRLTSGSQPLIERFEYRVIANCHEGTHIQSGPHVRASSPNRPAAAEGPAIPVQGGYPDQGGQSLAIQRAQLRRSSRSGAQRGQYQGRCGAAPPAPSTLDSPATRVEVVVQGGQPGVEPGDMGLDVRLEPRERTPQAVLFGCPQGNQLPPPRQQCPSSSAWASGRGRGIGRTASASALRPARRAHPSWPTARWPWQSHALDGD